MNERLYHEWYTNKDKFLCRHCGATASSENIEEVDRQRCIWPKSQEDLIDEYRKHALEYEWLLSKGHLDDRLSVDEQQEFIHHREEMEKLARTLDCLYPNWSQD